MTESDIELVRLAYSRFDLSSGEFDPDIFTEDCVFQPSVTGSETPGHEYVGVSGRREYQKAASEVWSSLTPEVHELRSFAPGVVVFEGKNHGVGRSSGVPVTTPHFGVARFREGRIAEMRIFHTEEEALEFAATIADPTAGPGSSSASA
jgi:ketosteroid isomerase-like protein